MGILKKSQTSGAQPIGAQPTRKRRKLGVLVFGLLLIVALGVAVLFWVKANVAQKELSDLKQNPQKIAQEEAKQIIEKVGKLIVLPEGEEPTIATIVDVEKLKDQPFFAKASNGDKVLIYTSAGKAILFNPASNKIVEVAPVNIGNQAASGQPPAAPAEAEE